MTEFSFLGELSLSFTANHASASVGDHSLDRSKYPPVYLTDFEFESPSD